MAQRIPGDGVQVPVQDQGQPVPQTGGVPVQGTTTQPPVGGYQHVQAPQQPQVAPQPHVAPQQMQAPQPQGPSAQQVIVNQVRTPETKEFFKTSEFVLWVLGAAAILIASGMIDVTLDAPLAWRLITTLSIGYILSRGFAKAAARRGQQDIDSDYDQMPSGDGMASRAAGFAAEHIATRETKEFFKTSEFGVWLLTVIGIFIATAAADGYDGGEAWNHATWVTTAYLISRGLSKLGTRKDESPRRNNYAGSTTL